MMKSHTDLAQSRKLEKFLSPDTADMFIIYVGDREIIRVNDNRKDYDHWDTVPVWSLSALFDILPVKIRESSGSASRLRMDKNERDYHIRYKNLATEQVVEGLDVIADNYVDAAVEMIVRLHKQKLLFQKLTD